mgnify:CR=1 FL=1
MKIIIDNSGSMNENGKKEALQLWLLAFEQLAKKYRYTKVGFKGFKRGVWRRFVVERWAFYRRNSS